MIIHTGFMPPSKQQLDQLRRLADESFCAISNEEFMRIVPSFEGWQPAEVGATLLKLKNVEPHDDPWVGRGAQPRVRRAIFWLMHGGESYSGRGVYFGCGRHSVHLKPGEFVVFNDTVKHWVMSHKQWRGAAWQLRKVQA